MKKTVNANQRLYFYLQADQEQTPQKRRTFRKFSYRGVDLEQLLDLSSEQVGWD